MPIDRIINTEDPAQMGTLYQELGTLRGFQHVQIHRKVRKASHAQFAWYYSCLVPRAKAWLNDSQGGNDDGEDFGDDETDLWLKTELRGKEIWHRDTGLYMGKFPPLKRYWDTRTMVEFVEDVLKLLKDNGVNVPPPDKAWREAKAAARVPTSATRAAYEAEMRR